MRLLSQFPGLLISLRRGDAKRIILGESKILEALLEARQLVDMWEQSFVESRSLLSREVVARHATSLANCVAQI
jgi:hypothetical protein